MSLTSQSLGAAFTNTSIPTSSDLNATCELPLGFVFTPLRNVAKLDDTNNDDGIPVCSNMQLCCSCLSYLNNYCPFDASRGIWTCIICQQQNKALPECLSSKVMTNPVVEYRQAAAGYHLSDGNDVVTDESNSFPDILMIVLDGNIPSPEIQCILDHLSSILSKRNNILVGLIIFTSVINVYQVGLENIASADIYGSKNDPLKADDTCIGFEERMYLGKWNGAKLCASAYFGLFGSNRNDKEKNSRSSSNELSRKEKMRLKRENRLEKEKNMTGENVKKCTLDELLNGEGNTRKRVHKRCTGEAVAYALHIASSHDPRSGRILLFTSGCPNVGSGSVTEESESNRRRRQNGDIIDLNQMRKASLYFDLVGKKSFERGIGIDIFCGGRGTMGAPALLKLVKPTGGYVLSDLSFLDEKLSFNIKFVLTETHMSISKNRVHDGDDIKRVREGYQINTLNGCVVDLRMPSFVRCTKVVGPVMECRGQNNLLPNERSAFASNALGIHDKPSTKLLESTLLRIIMGRYDPLATISAMLKVTNNHQLQRDEYAYFQFVVRFVNQNTAQLVTRVFNHRLSTSKEASNFIENVVEDVIPIVLGREAAYRTIIRGKSSSIGGDNIMASYDDEVLSSEVRKDLDTTIYNISKAYRQLYRESYEYPFPPKLLGPLKRLHHFRRGVIIGPSVHCSDEKALLCDLFLRLPLHDCLCMITPTMWSFRYKNGFLERNQVPPETLALWGDAVIATDNHDSMFIWHGRTSPRCEKVQKECKELLLTLSRKRFPAPKLYIHYEGDSMERKFITRLVPSHGGEKEEQLTSFPEFLELSTELQESVRTRFSPYYPSSNDISFKRWFCSVTEAKPPPNGTSLCGL